MATKTNDVPVIAGNTPPNKITATLPFETVRNEEQLNQDLAAIAGRTGSYTITLGDSFGLTTDLLAVNLGAGGSLTLQGSGHTIDGANRFRGLFDYSGALIVDDLTIADTRASGGNGGQGSPNGGGGGGGGAGLGGGLFVAAGGNTTLNNVTFRNDSAVGGNGGNASGTSSLADGGGGGLGGDGGNGRQVKDQGVLLQFGGSGGGIGTLARGGSLSPGGLGLIPTPTGTTGNGGGTGSGKNEYVPGGGGVAPSGLLGGFGGGGGGSERGGGANGGFGGGGAGGGNGGFGGGGGGDTIVRPGGFGAGSGGTRATTNDTFPGGGGGGLGAGADIFVAQGGQLTIGIVGLNAGTVAGGSAGSQSGGIQGTVSPTAGQAFGNGIFIQGNQSITFAPPVGMTTTISSIIADMNGSIANGGGAGSVVLNGAGTLKLAVPEPYTGGTKIGSGTLELVNPNAAGTGSITFGGVAPGGPAVLRIDTLAMPANTITGLGTGDTIDFAALPFVVGATAQIVNNKLTVISGGQTVTLNVLSPNATLATSKDVNGGTEASPFFPVVTDEQQLNADLAAIAGTTTAHKITIGASFSLMHPLLAINLGIGGSLTIDGGGFALNGGNLQRGFLVYSGNVTIDNLVLDKMTARGGAGGNAASPGGGGAGLGGGLLVASGSSVTLDNVTFSGNRAIGGPGGSFLDTGFAGGGGGGLGGDGGRGLIGGLFNTSSDGGGGGIGFDVGFLTGRGGEKDTNSGLGGAGTVPGAASGGHGGQGTLGGINGGGGGDAARGDGGGGGIGGQDGNSAGNYGGNGGWGGGGGGGGGGLFDSTNGGGSGGFGGGAGGFANSAHAGGFGGGGGGGGDSPGVAGFGGGAGGGNNFGGGGGGAAFGADVFVQQGGKLTIKGGSLEAGAVAGGSGGTGRTPATNNGKPGSAAGTTIFEQGSQAITFAPDSGQILTVEGGIADQDALSPGAGAGSVVVNGSGTVKLEGSNSYTGGTSLQSGTLELVSKDSAGTGAITFGGSGSATEILQLDYVRPGATAVTQAIDSLGVGASRIYLPNVSAKDLTFESDAGNLLTFKAGNTTYVFRNLDEIAGDTINASSIIADPSGKGVDILAVPSHGKGASTKLGNDKAQTIAEGAGQTVDAGAGGDTVTLSKGSASLIFHGSNDRVFLGGSDAPVNATIKDEASGLTVVVMTGGKDVFQGFGNDPSALVDLVGGVGGYTNVADVMSALTPDGAGGSLLALGGGQSIDFLGVAPSALHTSNFQVG